MLKSKQLNLSNVRYFVLDEADRLSQDNLDTILMMYNAVITVRTLPLMYTTAALK